MVGDFPPPAARELGVPAGTPVVIGAGDRASEVIGAGAQPDRAHGQLGHHRQRGRAGGASARTAPVPGLVLSRAAGATDAGWLLEGGLSAAGALLDWLADPLPAPAGRTSGRGLGAAAGGRGVRGRALARRGARAMVERSRREPASSERALTMTAPT